MQCLNKHFNKKVMVHNPGPTLYYFTLSKELSLFNDGEFL